MNKDKDTPVFPILRGESVSEAGEFSGRVVIICEPDELEREWKKGEVDYKDIKAEYWKPGQAQAETCPEGCKLTFYDVSSGSPHGWRECPPRNSCPDFYFRETRICRTHGIARIYVITGTEAAAINWTP